MIFSNEHYFAQKKLREITFSENNPMLARCGQIQPALAKSWIWPALAGFGHIAPAWGYFRKM